MRSFSKEFNLLKLALAFFNVGPTQQINDDKIAAMAFLL